MIGGDIAAVATKTFSNMASGVISGIGGAIMESPMSAIGSMVNVALPALITMGGLGLIPKMLGAGFKSGTFGQIGRKASGAM